MTAAPPLTEHGRELWNLLPEVYRTRDGTDRPADDDARGDLARYLDVFGGFLDRVRATLDQRFADCFPDDPDDPDWPVGESQPWLLPYFAKLLDVSLHSPHADGRRREISGAIAVRQRKGTLRAAELIAEAVAGRLEPGVEGGRRGVEVELQEGWRRVARTMVVAAPVLAPQAFGVDDPDLLLDPPSPSVAARHPGLPAGTIDFRLASRAVESPAPHPLDRTSTFGTDQVIRWRQLNPRGAPCFPDSYEDVSMRTVDLRDPTWEAGHAHPKRVLVFATPHLGFFGPGGPDPEALAQPEIAAPVEPMRGRVLQSLTITSGTLVLDGCAVGELVVQSGSPVDPAPVLVARGCLFGRVEVAGRAQLEYCTVLGEANLGAVDASDCLFAGTLSAGPEHNCLRYARVPADFDATGSTLYRSTTDAPVFTRLVYCEEGAAHETTGAFGEPGSGVLHPAAPESIRGGAEDGGEMGVYHDLHHVLEDEAVLEAVGESLPVGVTAVSIPDPRLLVRPPLLEEGTA